MIACATCFEHHPTMWVAGIAVVSGLMLFVIRNASVYVYQKINGKKS